MAIDTKLQIDLYQSLNSLFYMSWISGVIPYSMSAYNRLKQFQTSIFSVGYMIVMAVHIVLEYHFAAKEFAWGDSSQSGTLTLIIGICILYLIPVMLVIDVIGIIVNRNILADCLDRLHGIDEKLMKQNITINYIDLQQLSSILLGVITLFEYVLVIYDCFLFPSLTLKSFWWLITIFPIWSSSISKVWFIVLVFNIQQKFKAINAHLEHTKNFIFETKNRLNSARTKSQIAKRRFHEAMDYPGYLHKEIFTTKLIRRNSRQTTDQPGVIQVLPVHNDNSTDIPSMKNTIENFIPFYSEMLSVKDKNFLIDDKLDKKLTTLCHIHDEICDTGKTVNRMFSFQMLILMAHGFMTITAQFYFMYCGLMKQNIPLLFRSADSIFYSLVFIAYTAAKCVYVILMSWRTKINAQKTGVHIHKVANVVDEDHCYQIVNHLSLKLLNHKLNFTACGFFDLDMTTLYAITGAITSYLIILIQFNLAAQRSKKVIVSNVTSTAATSLTTTAMAIRN